VVICLERGADLHMSQLMPLPLTVSCFSKIQIGFTCLLPAHLGSPRKRAVKCVCVKQTAGCFVMRPWSPSRRCNTNESQLQLVQGQVCVRYRDGQLKREKLKPSFLAEAQARYSERIAAGAADDDGDPFS